MFTAIVIIPLVLLFLVMSLGTFVNPKNNII